MQIANEAAEAKEEILENACELQTAEEQGRASLRYILINYYTFLQIKSIII